MKKIMITILIIIISLYIFVILFFYLKQESIFFHPVKTAQNYQYKFPTTFKEIFYKTPKEGNIHSIRFTVEKPKGIILYLHGNAGNLEDWAWIYTQYTTRGYDVEIIDYRNYGKSIGQLSEENMHTDVAYIYNEIQKRYSEKNIIVHGRSIGTGIAVKLCSTKNPKALILESPYYNILDIAKNVAPFLPLKLLLKYKFESNQYISKITAPIYILHGTNDAVIPFKSGKKLYKIVEDKANFLSFKNGTHSNLATFQKYQLFLDEILK